MPSSVIRSWHYDETENRLDILFVSGRRYSYHAVPPRIAQGMRRATSKGSFFNRCVRDRFVFTHH